MNNPVKLVHLFLLAATSFTAAAPQPNIVHILADDLGWQDIACYYRAAHGGKESVYETPHLDRIAAQGMRFMQAYSPSATCSPSRAAIMAGQFTTRTGVLHVTGGGVPTPFNASFAYMDGFYPCRLDLETPTIARVLKDAGYTTAHIKKWHLGGRNDGYPGPLDYGFDFSWDAKTKDYNDPALWDSSAPGKTEYYNGLWLPLNPRHKGFATDNPNDPYRTDPGDDDRPLDGVSDLALRWLAKAKDGGKPFFLNLCPSLVHGPISTRDRKRLQHRCDKMGVPFPTDPGKITDKKNGQVNPYYAAMVDGLDWSIGKVLTFLETTDDPRQPGQKLIANTWLIISSDNGGAEGNFAPQERVADNSPLREGKSTVYEGGLRIPFIVMAPGVKPGSVSETPVNLIDLFPTFMSIAGAPRREDLKLDGCDLLPLLLGKETVGVTRSTSPSPAEKPPPASSAATAGNSCSTTPPRPTAARLSSSSNSTTTTTAPPTSASSATSPPPSPRNAKNSSPPSNNGCTTSTPNSPTKTPRSPNPARPSPELKKSPTSSA